MNGKGPTRTLRIAKEPGRSGERATNKTTLPMPVDMHHAISIIHPISAMMATVPAKKKKTPTTRKSGN
jgi:hypothetical protein